MKKTELDRLMNLPHTWEKEYKLAIKFSELLENTLTIDEFRLVIQRNAAETSPNVCHSHDFLDANMVMNEAFEEVIGRGVVFYDGDMPHTEAVSASDIDLFNKAWKIAKGLHFSQAAIKAQRDTSRQPRMIRVREGEAVYEVNHRTGVSTNGIISGKLRFNFQEWRAFHQTSELPDEIDSNDLGYWWTEKGQLRYRKPNAQWRKLMVNLEGVI